VLQLEEEIQDILELEGLRKRAHVLELARLMVRAESEEHRMALLKIIQVRLSLNTLKKTSTDMRLQCPEIVLEQAYIAFHICMITPQVLICSNICTIPWSIKKM
jgi:hypothetical protein